MVHISDDIYASRLAVLQKALTHDLPLPTAAKQLATISLSDDLTTEGGTEGGLYRPWGFFITSALHFPEHQDKLACILAYTSMLPDAQLENGEPLVLHHISIPTSPPDQRAAAISDFINLNKFTAQLMATERPVFNYNWFALITFRTALETAFNKMPEADPLDAYICAAAAWIEILGVEMYRWDKEFEQGPFVGAPGRGGPLWKGKHGFCVERWRLWRHRFGEAARMENRLSEEVKTVATEAESMMREIERGDVE